MFQTRKFDYKLFKFNEPQAIAWLRGGQIAQKAMGAALVKQYPQGVGIVLPQPMYLCAVVSGRGAVRELPKPWKLINFWEIDNRPVLGDCPCGDFADHETGRGEPWRSRFSDGKIQKHHPLCQYEPGALQTYGVIRQQFGNHAAARPDAWNKIAAGVKENLGFSA